MIEKLRNYLIDQFTRSKPLIYENQINRWVEYCYINQNGYSDQQLWYDYILAQIYIALGNFKSNEKLEAWLNTDQGSKYFLNENEKGISLEILLKSPHAENIPYCEDDIVDEVFNLLKESAGDYELDD